ncbi:MAG: hypothetical protein GXP47_10520 [Acidobacteria bacterium]|nr:hypothetical protein [Acidobacteriota bacterium]
MEMLRKGDMEALAALTGERPAVVRHLLARLWDAEATVRERAVEALGTAAGQHPELGLELLRRFAWALNDESGTNAVNILPAMAVVVTELPGLAGPFVGPMVAALGDPGLAETARMALGWIGAARPELLEPYRTEIERRSHDGGATGADDRGEPWDEN